MSSTEAYRGYPGLELVSELNVLYIDLWEDAGVDMNNYRVKISTEVAIILKTERDRNTLYAIKESAFR